MEWNIHRSALLIVASKHKHRRSRHEARKSWTLRGNHRLPDSLRDLPVPLWAVLYLLFIAALAVWAVVDDVRQGDSLFRVSADVAAIVVLCYLFAGYFVRALAEPLGRAAAPLFIAAFLWTGIAAQREIADDDEDPELTPRANFIAAHLGIALGVVMFAPLIAFAGKAALDLWQGV